MSNSNPFWIMEERLIRIEALLVNFSSRLTAEANRSTESDQLLTVKEAAELLNLAVPTLYGMVQRREIPFSKLGKRLYFCKEELIEWVRKNRRSTNAEIQAEVRKGVRRG